MFLEISKYFLLLIKAPALGSFRKIRKKKKKVCKLTRELFQYFGGVGYFDSDYVLSHVVVGFSFLFKGPVSH